MDYPDKVKQAYEKVRDKERGEVPVFKAKVPNPEHGDTWGKWTLDADRLVLVYREPDGREKYEIDLEHMTTSAQMLDWIFQINTKGWATRKDIGDLVQSLDDLFGPQGSLCSHGSDKHLDATEYLRHRLSTRKPTTKAEARSATRRAASKN